MTSRASGAAARTVWRTCSSNACVPGEKPEMYSSMVAGTAMGELAWRGEGLARCVVELLAAVPMNVPPGQQWPRKRNRKNSRAPLSKDRCPLMQIGLHRLHLV